MAFSLATSSAMYCKNHSKSFSWVDFSLAVTTKIRSCLKKSKSFNFQAVEQQEQELADWSVRLVNATWVYHTKRVKDTGEAFEININAKKGI